ncbi:hypothetical protein CKN86_01140 [Carnobacterium divergens]|nr:hypothetical protein CKN62_01140 [Carnobacterium divergens]TFI92079.1 hypothetical protein CKN84_01140 [Carnobacterium divergens]TFJ07302.1 hypothetical protein CKN86_01140 [Carnobacterium divergens]TFJ08533.1 hypothetical protein CKN65_01140 [Carnobacterium divergens]
MCYNKWIRSDFLIEAYKNLWKNGFNSKGSTSRLEFWLTLLCDGLINGSCFLLYIVLNETTIMLGIFLIYKIVSVIPILNLSVRRFHDAGYSTRRFIVLGIICQFIPILDVVGMIFCLVVYLQPSKKQKEMKSWMD